jgi:uncharacterized protein YbjT (DUF2867 family)
MSNHTILVAGATGYLGRFLTASLKDHGWRVRVLVRDPGKLTQPGPALSPVIDSYVDEAVVGDVTRPDTIRGAADGCSVVFSTVSLMGSKSLLTWHEVD